MLKRPDRRTGPRGFTLMEVLVAMVIIGVVIVALYGAITWGFRTIRLARENFRATQIMVEKMESLRLYTWSQLNTTNFVPTTFSAPYDPIENNGITYAGTITISPPAFNSSYKGDLRQVTVQVSWTSQDRSQTRQLSTYVARSGIQNFLY